MNIKSVIYPIEKYLKQFDDYINSFNKMNPKIAKDKAKKSLIRSGILTKNGKVKKNIINRGDISK